MEHQLQETIVKESELDWTIVRPGKLTNGRKTGQYKHGFPYSDSSLKVEVSRADVAEFLITQLNSGQYLRKAAGISY